MKGGTLGYFTDKWADKVASADYTIDWSTFEINLTKSFKDGIGQEIAEWRIEKYQQKSEHIANFLIKFDILKTKAETNDAHAIFLLKKNAHLDIIKTILRYFLTSIPKDYKGLKTTKDGKI
jgi:hypothetical protein